MRKTPLGHDFGKPVVIARLLPESNKLHQNQEIYHGGGIACTLKSSHHKDAPKVLIVRKG